MLHSMFAMTKLRSRRWAELAATSRWPVRAAAALAVVLVAGGAAIVWLAARSAAAPSAAPAFTAPDPAAPALALVFVSGAVERPGMYRLSPDARIADAIAAAGGMRAEADTGRLPDLASRVHDGKQINVPFQRSGRTSISSATAKLDVNTATLDQLRRVPGMPMGLPEAIVDYREQFGPFRSLSDMRVQLGLDGPTVTGLRPHLRAVAVLP
jgi:competence protein ComEA